MKNMFLNLLVVAIASTLCMPANAANPVVERAAEWTVPGYERFGFSIMGMKGDTVFVDQTGRYLAKVTGVVDTVTGEKLFTKADFEKNIKVIPVESLDMNPNRWGAFEDGNPSKPEYVYLFVDFFSSSQIKEATKYIGLHEADTHFYIVNNSRLDQRFALDVNEMLCAMDFTKPWRVSITEFSEKKRTKCHETDVARHAQAFMMRYVLSTQSSKAFAVFPEKGFTYKRLEELM